MKPVGGISESRLLIAILVGGISESRLLIAILVGGISESRLYSCGRDNPVNPVNPVNPLILILTKKSEYF